MFIVFDGPDGSGKTTLAAAVANTLAAEGHDVCLTREPYLDTTRAWLFDQRVTPRELAIAFAHDRSRHLHEVVRPALAAGKVVICDRYVLSTIIYQSQHVDLAFVAQLIEGTQEPDLTIVVDAPTSVCMARQAAAGKVLDRFEARSELQEAVRAEYLRLAQVRSYPVLRGEATPDRVLMVALDMIRPRLSAAWSPQAPPGATPTPALAPKTERLLKAAAQLGDAVVGLEVSHRGQVVSLRADGAQEGEPWVAVIFIDDEEATDVVLAGGPDPLAALNEAVDEAEDLNIGSEPDGA